MTTHKKYRGSRSGPTLSLSFLLLMLIPLFTSALDTQESLFTATPIPFWETSGTASVTFNDNGYVNVTGGSITSWLEDFPYRKSHNILPSSGAGINYQVMLTIRRSTGTDSGNTVYVGTKCRTDYTDIAFTAGDGTTLLDFWTELYNVTLAIVWIEISDSLSTNVVTIYFYYGSVGWSYSNGPDTFIFFDDFELNSFSRWTAAGSYWSTQMTTVKNGAYAAYGDAGTTAANRMLNKTFTNVTYGVMTHAWIRKVSVSSAEIMLGYGNVATKMSYATACNTNDMGTYYTPVWQYYALNGIAAVTWYRAETGWDMTNHSYQYYQDRSTVKTELAAKWTDASRFGGFTQLFSQMSTTAGSDLWLDDVYIRKWLPSEPIHSTWGTEETNIGPATSYIKIPIPFNKDLVFDFTYDYNQSINALQNATFSLALEKNSVSFGTLTLDPETLIATTAIATGTFKTTGHIKVEVKYALNSLRYHTYDIKDHKETDFYIYMLNKNYQYFLVSAIDLIGSYQIGALKGDIDYNPILQSSTTIDDKGTHSFGRDAIEAGAENVHQHANESLFVPSFQFVRTQMICYWSITGWNNPDTYDIWQMLNVDFYYKNGTKMLTVYGDVFFTHHGVGTTRKGGYVGMKFANGTNLYIDGTNSSDPSINANEWNFVGKIAIWRTQENHLGLGYYSTIYQSGYSVSPLWGNDEVSDYNLTTYITPFEISNFQANMTYFTEIITNDMSTTEADISFSANEYAYGNLAGVSQPHFSTNWWDTIPIVGWIINGFIFVAGIIVNGLSIAFSAIAAGLSAILSPIISLVGTIIVSALTALSGILSGILDSILAVLGGIAAGVWELFTGAIDAIIAGITGLAVAIGDYVATVIVPALTAGLLTLVTALIDIVIWVVDALGALFGITDLSGTMISLGIAFVSAAQSAVRMAGIVINTIVVVLTSILDFLSTYGLMFLGIAGLVFVFDFTGAFLGTMKTGEISMLEEFAARWGGALKKIFDIMWSVVSTVINFIGGVIP